MGQGVCAQSCRQGLNCKPSANPGLMAACPSVSTDFSFLCDSFLPSFLPRSLPSFFLVSLCNWLMTEKITTVLILEKTVFLCRFWSGERWVAGGWGPVSTLCSTPRRLGNGLVRISGRCKSTDLALKEPPFFMWTLPPVKSSRPCPGNVFARDQGDSLWLLRGRTGDKLGRAGVAWDQGDTRPSAGSGTVPHDWTMPRPLLTPARCALEL